MRQLFLFVVICIIGVSGLSAQNSGHRHNAGDRVKMWKELQEFKIKFLAQEADIREDQRERFADIYDEMSQKRMAAFKPHRELENKIRKKGEQASDEDYKALQEAMDKAKAKDAEIEKEYDLKFSDFLSSKQIYKLKMAEGKFRDKMAEMRGNKGRREKNK